MTSNSSPSQDTRSASPSESSRGQSSSAATSFNSGDRSRIYAHLEHWLGGGIEDAETAEDVDVVLGALLQTVQAEGGAHMPSHGALRSALGYVGENIRDDAALQHHLTAYRNASSSESRHAQFVGLSNHALDIMREASVVGLRAASALDILFVRNETLPMRSKPGLDDTGEPMQRLKPSVVITSRRAARAHYSGDVDRWDSLAALGSKTPSLTASGSGYAHVAHAFNWSDVLGVVGVVGPGSETVMKGKKRAMGEDAEIDTRPAKRAKQIQSGTCITAVNFECKRPNLATFKAEQLLAACAASMLSRDGPVAHVVGLFVEDECVELWWYDREGAIRVSAIDIVKDLDRFLVLLLCFQRFNLKNWGLLPELDFGAAATHLSDAAQSQPPTRVEYDTCTADLGQLSRPFSFKLGHRGTTVVDVQDLSPNDGFTGALKPDWYKPDERMEAIVKISWVDAARTPEPVLVATVRNRITTEQDEERVGRHLPWIADWKDHTPSTGRVRELFGVKRKTRVVDDKEVLARESQVLRSFVAEKLEPVQGQGSLLFLKAFLGIIGCVFGCWERDVHYRDPSLNNCMYRMIDGRVYGVPNDFDLATTADAPYAPECTGTIPFMALDLLQYPPGSIIHHLKHDLEALFWVFCWSCCADTAGRRTLLAADHQACELYKRCWLLESFEYAMRHVRPGWEGLLPLAQGLRGFYWEKIWAKGESRAEIVIGPEDLREDEDDEDAQDIAEVDRHLVEVPVIVPIQEPVTKESTLVEWTSFAQVIVDSMYSSRSARLKRHAAEFQALWADKGLVLSKAG